MTSTDPYVGFEISQEARILFIIIGIFYVVMGTFGNLLIIVTVAGHRVLRTLHGIYIVNLAVADLIILGYVVSYLLVDLLTGRYSVAGPGHCVFNGFLIVCAYVASLLTLTVISINRYLNICHSDTYRRVFTKHTTITICVCIWVVAALMTLPPLVGWGRFRYDRKLHYCGYDRTANFGYTLFLLLGSIAAPAIIIFICNFYIYRYVRNAKNRIRQSGLPFNRTPKPAEISLIKTLFAVFLCFAALMSPYMITTIADRDDTWPATVHIACSYTSFTNSCVNWFLYGLMNRSFREGYKKTLCFWRQPTQLSPDNMHVDNVLPGTSKISDRTRSTEEGNGVNHIESSCNNLLTVKPYTHYPKYESTGPQSECPLDKGFAFDSAADICYKVLDTLTTADSHRATCQAMGGQLMAVTSAARDTFLTGQTNVYNDGFFFGARYDGNQWTWETGAPYGDYLNWDTGHPDDATPCARKNRGMPLWRSFACDKGALYSVCEFVTGYSQAQLTTCIP